MTANTAQRVDVVRLTELLAKATPGITWESCERGFGDADLWFKPYEAWTEYDNKLQRGTLSADDAALFAAAVNSLPALLLQVAELEEYKRLSDEANGTLKTMCAVADAKLAEQAAEIDFVRSGLRNRGEYIEGQPPLPLALLAYDHMRIRAEAAERAREEAIMLAAAVLAHRHGDLPTLGYLRDNDASRLALANLAAFLAANGGGPA